MDNGWPLSLSTTMTIAVMYKTVYIYSISRNNEDEIKRTLFSWQMGRMCLSDPRTAGLQVSLYSQVNQSCQYQGLFNMMRCYDLNAHWCLTEHQAFFNPWRHKFVDRIFTRRQQRSQHEIFAFYIFFPFSLPGLFLFITLATISALLLVALVIMLRRRSAMRRTPSIR